MSLSPFLSLGLREDPLTAVKMLREPQTEIDPLSPEEIDAFLEACPAWWRPYFAVAFWTGARPNELAALKWGDVDGASARFRIRAGRYRGVESAPKTAGSVRDVDCLPPVVEALRAQKAQQAAVRLKAGQGAAEPGQDYVFTGPEGGLLNVNNLRDHAWYGTLKKAALRRRTMYQTRHTFASNALAAGEAPSWVAAQLGHTTPEMLFTVYARFIPNRTRRDGSALLARMTAEASRTGEIRTAQEVSRSSRRKISSLEKLGAEGGTRTPTGCPTRPSNVRVCQFRHFGEVRGESITLSRATDNSADALAE